MYTGIPSGAVCYSLFSYLFFLLIMQSIIFPCIISFLFFLSCMGDKQGFLISSLSFPLSFFQRPWFLAVGQSQQPSWHLMVFMCNDGDALFNCSSPSYPRTIVSPTLDPRQLRVTCASCRCHQIGGKRWSLGRISPKPGVLQTVEDSAKNSSL